MLLATRTNVRPLTDRDGLRAARSEFRRQIARLERQLEEALTATPLHGAVRGARPARRPAPRLLTLAELERQRDDLIAALAARRAVSIETRARHAQAARELEAIMADPRSFKFARIRNSDLGLPGCTAYEVRPRLGFLGMLAGWWEVRMSSGCP